MSTFTDLRTAIVARLNTVTNVGRVHERLRWTVEPATFYDKWATKVSGYQSNAEHIRAWWVGLDEGIGVAEDDPFTAYGEETERYRFVVHGVFGFMDAADSESTFVDLVLAVRRALSGQSTWGVSGVAVQATEPIQVRVIDVRRFADRTVHYTEILVRIPVERTL